MEKSSKKDLILDALQEMLQSDDFKQITVSSIAKKAGVAKGSIYYYFSSKDEMLNALIKRTYADTLELAKDLVAREDLSIYERLSKIVIECVNVTSEFLKKGETVKEKMPASNRIYDSAYIHQQFMKHSIVDFKDIYTEMIQQEIDKGTIDFDSASELAEIILIVLTVKIDNTLSPSTVDETNKMIDTFIKMLLAGTGYPLEAIMEERRD